MANEASIREDGDAGEEPDRKILKVKVPTEHSLRLHQIKMLTGTNISETVTEALALYFREEVEAEVDE